MTDRPILFSGPMVKALLEGRKTQTRRLLKIPERLDAATAYPDPGIGAGGYLKAHLKEWDYNEGVIERVYPPYRVGDELWVKETFLPDPPADDDAWDDEGIATYVSWSGTGSALSDIPKALRSPKHVLYRATWETSHKWQWRPSLFMPRWASRLTLTVTDVRVQRLLEITEEDAIAEGVTDFAEAWDRPGAWEGLKEKDRIGITRTQFGSCRQAFHALWDHINGRKPGAAWDDSPWVVVCHFSCQLRNIDSPRVSESHAEALEPI